MNPQSRRISRRSLLAAAGAAPLVVPGRAPGAGGVPAPSNRITVGFIGVGGMGSAHVSNHLQCPLSQVLAVCDVDRLRREDAKCRIEQKYAEAAPSGRYRGCADYNDFRDLLARPDIDAVVIATGDRWHALATTAAARAGKDIYCEKPASLTIAEARETVRTVRRYGRVCQIGLQQRSTAEFGLAVRLIHEGRWASSAACTCISPAPAARSSCPPSRFPRDSTGICGWVRRRGGRSTAGSIISAAPIAVWPTGISVATSAAAT